MFYFPGCGSERLFSQVGLATQAMLWEVGVQTVLPPGYLCCGYPQRGSGQYDKAERIITDNRVLFHRMANTLNYLDIKTVVVSCGTCYDQLQGYEFDKIFPGSRIIDIHEFLMERNVRLEGVTGTRYMYHDPCHSPMKLHQPLAVVNQLMNSGINGRIEKNDRCCGESGTLAVTRPDISTQVRFRKEEEMRKGATALRSDGGDRRQGPDIVPVVPAGPVALRGGCDACKPTTSSSRSRGTCWARTGCRRTWPRRTPAESSGCWSSMRSAIAAGRRPDGAAIEVRVLVVEDDPLLGDGMAFGAEAARLGGRLGPHRVSRLKRPRRAAPYDAVVLDLGLPDGDGVGLLRRWRNRRQHAPGPDPDCAGCR